LRVVTIGNSRALTSRRSNDKLIPSGIRKHVPKFVSQFYWSLYFRKQAMRLNAAVGVRNDAAACCEALWEATDFRPLQRHSEAVSLFELVKALEPKAICEIGAFAGGTAFLFARASPLDSVVISIDSAFNYSRRKAIEKFCRPNQKLFCLRRNSQEASTVDVVSSLLGERQLDLLFIDGDHTYAGVSRDFNLYSPLVREGGLIIFHDIVPDSRARGGTDTRAFTGGVPQFWKEIKSVHTSYKELIEDPQQDGYGIGVLEWQTTSSTDGRRVLHHSTTGETR
jgi:predicted O-methyltransferase YrrM